MNADVKMELVDNPDFNHWLEENYQVEIEEYEFFSSEVLYKVSYEKYVEALGRYIADPKVKLSRIEKKFPAPIAYYFYQATNNYQNDHHRLDLLKSCWESIVYFLYGLVVGEARHRKLSLNLLGIKWEKYWSDKLYDKLTIVENILDYTTKSGIQFSCATVIPIATLTLIKQLNQGRNGFAHAAAKTSAQQKALYTELYPLLELVLRQLIKLEDVVVFRYHEAETPLYPRCEIFNGCSLDGKKAIVPVRKDNYIEIVDHFNPSSIYVKVMDEVFCISPFIHFFQEEYETNAVICFYKKDHSPKCHDKSQKYQFEVVSKSQNKEFDKSVFGAMENHLKNLVVLG